MFQKTSKGLRLTYTPQPAPPGPEERARLLEQRVLESFAWQLGGALELPEDSRLEDVLRALDIPAEHLQVAGVLIDEEFDEDE